MKKYLLCTVSLLVISSCRNENEISIVKTETASNEILALQLDDREPIRAGVNFLLEGKIISNQKISEAKNPIMGIRNLFFWKVDLNSGFETEKMLFFKVDAKKSGKEK